MRKSLARHEPFVALMRDEWTVSELAKAAEDVASLVEHPGWDVVVRLLAGCASRNEDKLKYSGGRVFEQAEYARALGEIAGFESPANAAEAVLVHAEQVKGELERRDAEASAGGGLDGRRRDG